MTCDIGLKEQHVLTSQMEKSVGMDTQGRRDSVYPDV